MLRGSPGNEIREGVHVSPLPAKAFPIAEKSAVPPVFLIPGAVPPPAARIGGLIQAPGFV